ncbi:MAG: hypothetical protein ING44_08625 [Telmatospirillum sp.]|nr:hypothetical protein [Telmatospirillum sp.]
MTATREIGMAARVLAQFDKRGLAASLFAARDHGDGIAIEVAAIGLDAATAEHIAWTCRGFVGMHHVELVVPQNAVRAA